MAENIPKDHISRTSVYNLLNAIGGCGADIETDPYTYGWDKAIDAAIEEIGKLPAVEYTPVKHGHWIDKPYPNYPAHDIRYCSECGWNIHKSKLRNSDLNWNYCPNCGAKMDG